MQKPSCRKNGREHFFEGEKYPPCENYVDIVEFEAREADRKKNLAEMKKITVPTARPDGAAPDCLYCKRLNKPHNFRGGPFQGEGKVCKYYGEISVRPAGEPQHCLYCLENISCERGRVLTNGKPCERYREYEGGK
jgi:hypothetical protein